MAFATQQQLKDLNFKISQIEGYLGNIDTDSRAVVRNELTNNATRLQQPLTQFGLYAALCVSTLDPWKQNRIKWYHPFFHDPELTVSQLPWAHAVSNLGGFDDCGATWVPPAGSTVCILFENGNSSSPFYIGTIWQRSRGKLSQPNSNSAASGNSNFRNFSVNVDEYYQIWEGTRTGYLVGPDDGSQVFPPWNTENYNGFDLSSSVDFDSNPDAQKLLTYPNIYGFKTPEKHMIKMVDGDPKCNRKWKRFEIMSSRGNWIMMKDDHLHYAGQWAHPSCGSKPGEVSCVEEASVYKLVDVLRSGVRPTTGNGQTNRITTNGQIKEKVPCEGKLSNKKIIGGHPQTGHPATKYGGGPKGYGTQVGANPFFKQKQECRPYSGAQTPQNNFCDLPQTGIQLMSISGHTLVMDDSVEEPYGAPTWDKEFDFGCNDHYVGRTYWKSATGHSIEMSDVESPAGEAGKKLRGEDNYIRILSANGNRIELNDHTVGKNTCPGCPPNVAGKKRGIVLESTSKHKIEMIDEGNEQCSPCRKDGGKPAAKATQAYIKIRSGYGLEMSFRDRNSQEETQQQSILIKAPQKDNTQRGAHLQLFQERAEGPGLVFLRVGGNFINSTYDNHITVVGNSSNPGNLIETVYGNNYVNSKKYYINVSEKSHYFKSNNYILLLAGEDCESGSCLGSVLVFDFKTGRIKLSDRVFASSSPGAPTASIFFMSPFVKD